MKARRSDKQRQQVFSHFIHKAPRMTFFSLKPIIATGEKHEASAKKHDAMLKKAKKKRFSKIRSWIKKNLSIFKVK